MIVEVLSDSTEKYARGKKSNYYRQIISLRSLILIAQERPHVECFTRQPNGDWLFHEPKELSAEFELKTLGFSVAMPEVYRGVKFELTEEG